MQQWAAILTSLGHEVVFGSDMPTLASANCQFLVALHAVKGHAAIEEFQAQVPRRPVILALTGTDIYPDPGQVAQESMERADALVVLQPKALSQIPEQHRHNQQRCPTGVEGGVQRLAILAGKPAEPAIDEAGSRFG